MTDRPKTLEDALAVLEKTVDKAEKRLKERNASPSSKALNPLDSQKVLDESERLRLQKDVEKMIDRIEKLLNSLDE